VQHPEISVGVSSRENPRIKSDTLLNNVHMLSVQSGVDLPH